MTTNLCTVPACKNDTPTGWFGPPGAGRLTGLTGLPRTTGFGAPVGGNYALRRVPCTAGSTYRLSAYVQGGGTASAGTANINWYGPDGYLSSSPAQAWSVSATGVTRVDSLARVAPAGAVEMVLVIEGADGPLQITAALYTQGSQLHAYFDGDSPGAIWNGPNGESTSTLPTSTPTSDEAAVRYRWVGPLPGSDEFNYVGPPRPDLWAVYGEGGDTGGAGSNCVPGHVQNGRRCSARATVNGQYLRISGLANGDTTGLAHRIEQRYGRWEIRARFLAAPGGGGGAPYHGVLIIWPSFEPWPLYGEYDWVEIDIGDTNVRAFLHYPHPPGPVQQVEVVGPAVNLAEFNNFAFEWRETGLSGWVNGEPFFANLRGGGGPNGRSDLETMPSGHVTIQLDKFNPTGEPNQPGFLDVEWFRRYSLENEPEGPVIPPDGVPLDPIPEPETPFPEFVDGELVTATELNDTVQKLDDLYDLTLGGVRPYKPACSVVLNGAGQTVPNNTDKLIAWDDRRRDADNMFTLAAPSIMTVQTTGWYRIGHHATLTAGSANAGSVLDAWITVDSTSRSAAVVSSTAALAAGTGAAVTCGGEVFLQAGQVLRFYIRQNSGSTHTLDPFWGGCRAYAIWVSP